MALRVCKNFLVVAAPLTLYFHTEIPILLSLSKMQALECHEGSKINTDCTD